MNYASFMQKLITIDDLPCNLRNFLLRESSLLLYKVFQRSFITELQKQVNIVCWLSDIIQSDEIIVFRFLHDLNLIFQGSQQLLRVFLDSFWWDLLDCYKLTCSYVGSFPNFTERTFADGFVDVNYVWINEFVIARAKLVRLFFDLLQFFLLHFKLYFKECFEYICI